MKYCAKCRTLKSLDSYSSNRTTKDGLQYNCKACNKAYQEANAEKRAEYRREYYQANRERLIAYWAEYREKHPDRVKASARANYQRYREKHLEIRRRYCRENPEQIRDHNDKRRAMLRGAAGAEKISRRRVWEREGGRCHICGERVPYEKATLDHLIPLSKGGEHSYLNVRIAHGPCNSRRGAGRLPAQLFLVA